MGLEKLLLLQMPENLHLNELAEGQIGKIKVYKSGKMIMSLNDSILMNVTLSVSGAFLQVCQIINYQWKNYLFLSY